MRTAAAFTLLLLGCSHLDIAPLPASPSPEQRLSTWQAFHGVTESTLMRCASEHSAPEDCTTILKTIHLANGSTTTNADDLLPLVRPDSDTARHAAHARSQRHWAAGLAAVALAVGISCLYVAISDDTPDNTDHQALWGAAGVVALGVLGGISYYELHSARDTTGRAFGSYNKDLGENLRICSFHNLPVPCEQVSPGGAPSEYLPPTARRTTRPSLSMR